MIATLLLPLCSAIHWQGKAIVHLEGRESFYDERESGRPFIMPVIRYLPANFSI